MQRGTLLSTAYESELPKGSWVLAGFAINPKRCEVLPYVWNMAEPESLPEQMSLKTKSNKTQLCGMARFLQHTNATMWKEDTDAKCDEANLNLLKERLMQLFVSESLSKESHLKKEDGAASKVTKRTGKRKKATRAADSSSEDEETLADRAQGAKKTGGGS